MSNHRKNESFNSLADVDKLLEDLKINGEAIDETGRHIKKMQAKPKSPSRIEKHIKISDILKHILDNSESFIQNKLKNVTDKEEAEKVLNELVVKFLIENQDCINYD